MNVTVHLKDGRSFAFAETAVFEDKEAGWYVLSFGTVTGGRITNAWSGNADNYKYTDESHICYAKRDVFFIEIEG